MSEPVVVCPSDKLGTVRAREETDGTVSIYTKVARNRWHVAYLNSLGDEAGIEGHVSDPVATRWPVVFRPKLVAGSPK